MDYEKKYKEALEWVRDLYPTMEGAVKEDAEHYFPELKESEDEKRIKWLIETINYVLRDGRVFHDKVIDEAKNALAWLEKQGEQKPVTDFSDLRTWKYIVDAVLTEKEGIGQYLDSPFTEEVAKKLQKRFGNIKQMPIEWSEEDERLFQIVIDILDRENHLGNISRTDLIACVRKLKSLRPQKQWKSAWSEEDERMLNSTIWHLRHSVNNGDIEYSAGRLEDWFESLKDRIK